MMIKLQLIMGGLVILPMFVVANPSSLEELTEQAEAMCEHMLAVGEDSDLAGLLAFLDGRTCSEAAPEMAQGTLDQLQNPPQ